MSHWSKFEKCCCCISLEIGTRLIGAVFLLISLGESSKSKVVLFESHRAVVTFF